MEYCAIVTILALIQYTWFGIQVGSMRGQHQVKAPTMTGPPEFERAYRVHYNTLEQLVLFLPALWLFAYFVRPLWGAAFGVVFLIGRFLYRASYLRDPASRGTGFTLTVLPSATMLLWVLVVAVRSLL